MNKYKKTKQGVVNAMYYAQRNMSKGRGHQPPNYTKEELTIWCFSQPIFHDLYNGWVNQSIN